MRIEEIHVTRVDLESYKINLKYSDTNNLHPKKKGIITGIDRFKGYLREGLSGLTGSMPPVRIDEGIAERKLLQQYVDEVLTELKGQFTAI